MYIAYLLGMDMTPLHFLCDYNRAATVFPALELVCM